MAISKDNTFEVKQLIEQSYVLFQNNDLSARSLAQQALAKSEPNSLEYAHASVLLAICLTREEKYTKSLESLLQAISYFMEHEDEWLLIAYYTLGVSYHQLNLFAEATDAHQKQYDIAVRLNAKNWMASALRRIGADHDHIGQPNRALEYYERSLELYRELDEQGGMAGVYNNMSIVYYNLGDYALSLEYAQKGLPIFEQINHSGGLAQIYGNGALALAALGRWDEALSYAQKGLNIAQERGFVSGLILAHLRCAKIYRSMEDYEQSEASLKRALALLDDNVDPHTGIEFHHEAYSFYEHSGNLEKALLHHQHYHRLKVKQLDEAMASRYETIAIIHRTQQARAEAERQRELREKDRRYFEKLNAMKDELLSTASHDLKNPLTNIFTVRFLLKRHGRIDDAYGQELLERINDSALQMRDLITNLLDLARLETGKSLIPQAVDIVIFTRNIAFEYQLLAENEGLQFNFSSNVNEQTLMVDTLMLRRVFVNLLSNALKFTPQGGTISFELEKHDRCIFITIEDNGLGIPPDDLPHIFERFYRVNNTQHQQIEGTGLGLPICKAIVDQHGGTISVTSVENVGTTFTVQLPISP